MARLQLVGGAYSARSIIAACSRAINYYPEINPEGAPVPMTHYQRPGLRPLNTTGAAPGRCLYRASDGQGFCIIGSTVYFISPSWALTAIGSVMANRTNICSMIDNGQQVLVVDGSPYGWTIDLATHAWAQVTDATGSFAGADRVDTIDTYVLWNKPGSRMFGSTLSDQISPFDSTYFGSKASYPDPLQTIIICRQQIILPGALKTEIWYNAGNPTFPFAELPGTYVEHGIVAKYSIASSDISTYWLAQDLQGVGVVVRLRGYELTIVSNQALSVAIRKMAKAGTIADAIGYTYQQDGHLFYVLTFPSADQTWVYDESIPDTKMAWHQRGWTDANGLLHRERANCHAFLYGENVVADWENGALYALDLDTYTDTVAGTSGPITYTRSFQHIQEGLGADGRPRLADGKRMQFTRFAADMEVGDVPLDSAGLPAKITLRYSSDRGKSFTDAPLQTAGAPGEYLTQPQWRLLGIARDCVFELTHSIAGPAALNGAWVEARVLET